MPVSMAWGMAESMAVMGAVRIRTFRGRGRQGVESDRNNDLPDWILGNACRMDPDYSGSFNLPNFPMTPLSPEEVNERVAVKMGWTLVKSDPRRGARGQYKTLAGIALSDVPDLLRED